MHPLFFCTVVYYTMSCSFCHIRKPVVVYCSDSFFFVCFFQTHSGSVWRVTWAHPEFGQVLASCSFDRTAAVWEEIVGESNDKQRGLSHWVSAAAAPSQLHFKHDFFQDIKVRFFGCGCNLVYALCHAWMIFFALILLLNHSASTFVLDKENHACGQSDVSDRR